MSRSSREEREDISRLLARELRTEHNARFLRTMPDFQVDGEVPAQFRTLLHRLEQSEGGRPR